MKTAILLSRTAALLAKINAWVRFENRQFSKIIPVALYVKMGAAMWGVKIRQRKLGSCFDEKFCPGGEALSGIIAHYCPDEEYSD